MVNFALENTFWSSRNIARIEKILIANDDISKNLAF